MIPRFPMPRLLPLTIVALAALLATKTVWLTRGWSGSGVTVVAIANAAGAETKAAEAGKGHSGAAPPKHGAAPASVAAPAEPNPPPGPPPVSDSERAVLLELRQRRQDLERREAAVAARESVLTAAEQKIASRVAEMRSLQKSLETLDADRQQREEASWQGLVKLYEAMKPRDAATIFNDLTMSVLLPLVGHMKETKAAPILAAMSPDKARDVTARLARSRSHLEPAANAHAAPRPADPAPPSPDKS